MSRLLERLGLGWILFILAMLLVVIGIGLIWLKWDSIVPSICKPEVDRERADCQKKLEILKAVQEERKTETAQAKPSAAEPITAPTETEKNWVKLTGSLPVWPEDLIAPENCAAVREDLLALCRELDSRPYIRARAVEGGCFELFSRIRKVLLGNPPIASGELLRFESVTSNVFHFFRVLGKDRLYLLRDILEREEPSAEPMAMALYRFLAAQERCAGTDGGTTLRSLYQYAAFFLNTLGGQGYMSRRSPKIESLATFYSLLILDRAIQKGFNPHGVDPRPHIRRCQQLMEIQDLVFRDRYLEILQDMAERWGSS